MEALWKAAAVMILTVILSAAISKTEKDISVVLSVAACCTILMVAMEYISEVTAFLWELTRSINQLNPVVDVLLHIVGVALITELTGLISADSGNGSLAKAMQVLGNAAILFLSLPIFEAFFSMIQEIMRFL